MKPRVYEERQDIQGSAIYDYQHDHQKYSAIGIQVPERFRRTDAQVAHSDLFTSSPSIIHGCWT